MCLPLRIILTYTASHWYILKILYPFVWYFLFSFYTGPKAVLLARLYKNVIFIDLIILIGFDLVFFHIVYAVQTELFRCLTFLF